MNAKQLELGPLLDALHWGERTPTAVVEDCLERIDSVDADVRAFVPETVDDAVVVDEAAELTETRASPETRGPLYGVPVGVKDIIHVAGLPTRAGSTLPPEAVTGREATVVSRLRDAGAILLGKTQTTEFAYFEPGPTRNPRDLERTPGGSSSGSAAAVAAGEVPLALGTQTVGSVIRPAAFCGVVGFVPSYGRLPLAGVIPFSPSVDRVGTFTADLDGTVRAARALVDDWTPVPTPPEHPTVGVPGDAYLEQAEDVGRAAFDEQVETLRNAGIGVVETNIFAGSTDGEGDIFADIEAVNERHERLNAAELAIAHTEAGWYPAYADEYSETTRALLEEGREYTAGDIADGRVSRGSLRRDLDAVARERGIDVWVSPAAPGPAPESLESTGDPVMNLPWTHAGLPTVSLPVAETDAGLPLGLQVAASYGADEELLAYASLLENVFTE